MHASSSSASTPALHVALVGNPNCGETALFNLLTSSRRKVANYAGVTVEHKEGCFTTPSDRHVQILSLPGAYSLVATSPDETITRDICLGASHDESHPGLLVCVVDATNLWLHLRFVLELQRLGLPVVLALNMVDTAERCGIRIDRVKLEAALDTPVVQTVTIRRNDTADLVVRIDHGQLPTASVGLPVDADPHIEVKRLLGTTMTMPRSTAELDDRLDRIVLHPVLGLMLLVMLMFFMLQAVFSWMQPLMKGIQGAVEAVGIWVGNVMPDSMLKSLLVNGIITGTGNVLVLPPQVLILFLFILSLKESGYLPRAVFLFDRLMVGAGLSGRSFTPLLSSFMCAIPDVMTTRTIQDPRSRLVTILVTPLMTCSAQLPVYALLVGAFISVRQMWGLFSLQGLVLFGLYMAGIVSTLIVAYVLKYLKRDHNEHPLTLELPSHRLPSVRNLIVGLVKRARIFLRRIGTIIPKVMVLLWFPSSFPTPPANAMLPAIDYSFAGTIDRALEVVFAPIDFTWQMCITLIPGMAVREMAVGALVMACSLSATHRDVTAQLTPIISQQWSLATALAFLAWYVYAPQCISTLATIRRETNSQKVMAGTTGYLFALIYLIVFTTYQITRVLT